MIAKLTLAQKVSIYEQLEQGVRALDLRVFYHEGQHKFYLSHSFATVPWEVVAKDIQDFLLQHPGEILLIELQNDAEHMRKTAPHNLKLLKLVEQAWGHWLITDTSKTIQDLVALDKRILLVFRESSAGREIVHEYWPNETNPGGSMSKIMSYLPELKIGQPGVFNLVFFTVTPDTGSIISNTISSWFGTSDPASLFDYAEAMKQPTLDFMKVHAGELSGLEIISVDVPSDELVTQVLERNWTRF